MLFTKKVASGTENNIIKIATWNVNSIRVRAAILFDFIREKDIDIVLIQETKCIDSQFPIDAFLEAGLNVEFVGQKSYNGVAIVSRFPLNVEMKYLPLYDLESEDNEARYIEATFSLGKKFFRVASIYVPMGGSILQNGETLEESKRFKYKLNFYERIKCRIKELESFSDEYVIFGGDFNVAQEEIDLSRPKENLESVGFHSMERQHIRDIQKYGLIDAFRVLYPNKIEYSWFDLRTRAIERNIGWRLDYLLSSKKIVEILKNCYTDMDIRRLPKTSDHAPVILELEF